MVMGSATGVWGACHLPPPQEASLSLPCVHLRAVVTRQVPGSLSLSLLCVCVVSQASNIGRQSNCKLHFTVGRALSPEWQAGAGPLHHSKLAPVVLGSRLCHNLLSSRRLLLDWGCLCLSGRWGCLNLGLRLLGGCRQTDSEGGESGSEGGRQ